MERIYVLKEREPGADLGRGGWLRGGGGGQNLKVALKLFLFSSVFCWCVHMFLTCVACDCIYTIEFFVYTRTLMIWCVRLFCVKGIRTVRWIRCCMPCWTHTTGEHWTNGLISWCTPLDTPSPLTLWSCQSLRSRTTHFQPYRHTRTCTESDRWIDADKETKTPWTTTIQNSMCIELKWSRDKINKNCCLLQFSEQMTKYICSVWFFSRHNSIFS